MVGSGSVVMFCRDDVKNLYDGGKRGPKEITWFKVNESRERDCFVSISDEKFSFR